MPVRPARSPLLLAAAAALAACAPAPADRVVGGQGGLAAGPALQAWHTDPGAAPGETTPTALEPDLRALIDGAERELLLAAYTLDRAPLIDALLAAWDRGVDLAVVTDGDELEDAGFVALAAAGVPITARRPGDRIMHHKFLVIDQAAVWTGSTNWTDNDLDRNDNDALLLRSPEVAAAYAEEHAELRAGRFGRSKDRSRAPLALALDGLPQGDLDLQLRFSPSQDPVPALVAAIDGAAASVRFATYSFTHPDVADALVRAEARGVEVIGLFDEGQASSSWSVDEELAAGGAAIHTDGNENASGFSGGKLHHKLLIVDGGPGEGPATVATGSTNWSRAGQQDNDENLVVLGGLEDVSAWMTPFCARLALATPVEGAEAAAEGAAAGCGTPALRLNELLPDPAWADLGEEYVELVNAGDGPMALAGVSLWDGAVQPRHTFAGGTLAPGAALVIFDTGDHDDVPNVVLSSTGRLGLNNSGERIRLTGPDGALLDAVSYPALPIGVAYNRAVDGAGAGGWRRHDRMVGAAGPASPGLRADGGAW